MIIISGISVVGGEFIVVEAAVVVPIRLAIEQQQESVATHIPFRVIVSASPFKVIVSALKCYKSFTNQSVQY